MNYFLKNFQTGEIFPLGQTPDEIVPAMMSAYHKIVFGCSCNGTCRTQLMRALCGEALDRMMADYNLEGCRTRSWLVLDSKGRHIAKNVVQSWIDNTTIPVNRCKFIADSSKDTRRNIRLPSLVRSHNATMDDPDCRSDIEELAGSHAANRCFNAKTLKSLEGVDAAERKYQQRYNKKSWKNERCRHQWQKHKRDKLGVKDKTYGCFEEDAMLAEDEVWDEDKSDV